jgi:uncharacterized protein YfaS (alpha-2-macroglobulin family)
VNTGYSFAVEYLGDADKGAPNIDLRKKFPDTAFWQPNVQTDNDGHATISFNLPDNLTTWRATVLAQTLDTSIGREVNKVQSAKDFFVRLEKPRVLTQKDESRLLALVHNNTGEVQTANLQIEAAGLSISGDLRQTMQVQPGAVGQASWAVTADALGDVKIKVKAWTPESKSESQYTDGVEIALPVRPHGRELLSGFAGQVTAMRPESEVLRLDPAAIPEATRLTVRITPSVISSLVGALDYLVGFPYGCTEQTMSRMLPDILVQRVLRLSGTRDAKLEKELPRMVRDCLARLARFQHSSGAWGWWEYDEDDLWMTAYVLYGLSVAKADGYTVSPEMLSRAREAAAKMVVKANKDKDFNSKMFLLYALALAGDKTTPQAALKDINTYRLGPEGLAYLVLLGKVLGADNTDALAELEKQAVQDEGTLYWKTNRPDYYYEWDATTATAAGLRALLAVNPKDPRSGLVLRWLMMRRTGDYWESTRDTSCVLAALCDYLKSQPGVPQMGGQVRVRLNGKVIKTYDLTPSAGLTGAAATPSDIVLRIPQRLLGAAKNDVTLERVGGTSPVFYSVQLRQTVASEDMAAVAPDNLSIKREYLRVLPRQAGQDRWTLQTEATNNQLKQGDQIRVRLTLNVTRDMSYVLIEDPFPSGCEVTERGTTDVTSDDWDYWWSSMDVRDDRIAFFARTLTKGKHTIQYNLRAQTPGSYHALPSLLQAMYAPETRAEAAETQVVVR